MDFDIGGRYRNRKGWYEVLAIRAGRLVVAYDDGDQAQLDPDTQRRCIANIALEESRVTPFASDDARLRDWAHTMGVLATHARLEAEVPPKAVAGFRLSYADATGDTAVLDCPVVYQLEDGVDKWGSELRIYFPRDVIDHHWMLPDGVSLVTGWQPEEMRINDNGFWWALVRDFGFRVGDRQDVAAIRDSMPEGLRDAFDVGTGAVAQ